MYVCMYICIYILCTAIMNILIGGVGLLIDPIE